VTDPYAPPKSDVAAADTAGAAGPEAPANRFVAVILTLLLLPAGHVFVGRTQRGLAWFLAANAVGVAGLALTPQICRVAGLGTACVVLGLAFVLAVVASVDAARLARKRVRRTKVWIVVGVAVAAFVAGRLVAVVHRALLIEAFKVPAGSMMPTISVGDHLFVDKKTRGSAQRGEVIVFPFPERPGQDFVKRVVGLGGDTIEVKGGHVSINGWAIPRCALGAWQYTETEEGRGYPHKGALSVEFLGDASYLIFEDDSAGGGDVAGPWTVKRGEVFVMGDNRNNSHDSRMWYGGRGGGVPVDTVRGRAFVVWVGQHEEGLNPSRFGVDLTGRRPAPPAGAPELAAAIDRCMAARPPGFVAPP
jgi:signal peptidase I